MAEDASDDRARYTDTASIDRLLAPATAKAAPIVKPRTAEGQARANFYTTSGNKEILPEHVARRDAYPLITVTTT